MRIRILLISAVLILCHIPLHGADGKSAVDSLYNCFQDRRNGSYADEANKIMLLAGDERVFTSGDGFDDVNAYVLDVIVDYLRSRSEYAGRLSYLNKALSFYSERNDSMNVARCYHTLGATYQMLGLYDKAIQSYQASSEVILAIGGDHSQFRYRYTLNNIAAIFFEQGDMEKCEEVYLKCLSLINDEEDENRNETDRSTYLGNLAMVYNAKAEKEPSADLGKEYLAKALEYETEAVAIAKKYCEGESNEVEIVKREVTQARTLMLLGDLDGAERILKECDRYIARNDLEYQAIQVTNVRAEIEVAKGSWSQAEKMYNIVYDYARRQGLKELEEQALEDLYTLLKDNRPSVALDCFEKRTAIRDSIFTMQQNILISEFQVQYQTQEKENLIMKQKSELRQSRIVTWSLAVIIILCICLLFVIHRYVIIYRRHNDELKTSNATKDKMISIISHDLKNPAFAQRNALRSLNASYHNLDIDTIGNCVNELLNSSESQVQLVSNLLDWARLQTGRLTCNPVECNLSVIIGNELRMVHSMARNKQITIETRHAGDDTVLADRAMVSAVFRNLITNAIKFSRTGGTVEVETGTDGDRVFCSVTDHGIGIAEDRLEQVFTDASVVSGTADEPGTGLGLELCRHFMDMNNGTIEVRSKVDEGSTFTFYLGKHDSGDED